MHLLDLTATAIEHKDDICAERHTGNNRRHNNSHCKLSLLNDGWRGWREEDLDRTEGMRRQRRRRTEWGWRRGTTILLNVGREGDGWLYIRDSHPEGGPIDIQYSLASPLHVIPVANARQMFSIIVCDGKSVLLQVKNSLRCHLLTMRVQLCRVVCALTQTLLQDRVILGEVEMLDEQACNFTIQTGVVLRPCW
jgi:hypothetical protein